MTWKLHPWNPKLDLTSDNLVGMITLVGDSLKGPLIHEELLMALNAMVLTWFFFSIISIQSRVRWDHKLISICVSLVDTCGGWECPPLRILYFSACSPVGNCQENDWEIWSFRRRCVTGVQVKFAKSPP